MKGTNRLKSSSDQIWLGIVMRILALLSLGTGLILLAGCGEKIDPPDPRVEVPERNWAEFPDERIIEESEIVTIPVDNRRGDGLIVQTVERSVSEGDLISLTKAKEDSGGIGARVGAGVEVTADIRRSIEEALQRQFSTQLEARDSIALHVPPRRKMTFKIKWTRHYREGVFTGKDGSSAEPFRVCTHVGGTIEPEIFTEYADGFTPELQSDYQAALKTLSQTELKNHELERLLQTSNQLSSNLTNQVTSLKAELSGEQKRASAGQAIINSLNNQLTRLKSRQWWYWGGLAFTALVIALLILSKRGEASTPQEAECPSPSSPLGDDASDKSF